MLSKRAIGMAALLAVCFSPAFAQERSLAGAREARAEPNRIQSIDRRSARPRQGSPAAHA